MSAPRPHAGVRPISPEQLVELTLDYAAIGQTTPAAPPLVCHETRTINLTALRLAGAFALAAGLTALLALIMAVLP